MGELLARVLQQIVALAATPLLRPSALTATAQRATPTSARWPSHPAPCSSREGLCAFAWPAAQAGPHTRAPGQAAQDKGRWLQAIVGFIPCKMMPLSGSRMRRLQKLRETAACEACLVLLRARDYPDDIKMTTAPLELRSAGSADADDLRSLQPSGGATAACGRFASSSAWCGTHDQAHSLLDPLQGHQRYTYVRDLHR